MKCRNPYSEIKVKEMSEKNKRIIREKHFLHKAAVVV